MQRQTDELERYRRPFWPTAVNYYLMAGGFVIALFFLVWEMLHDGSVEIPLFAAISAALIGLISAVLLREIYFKNKYLVYVRRQQEIEAVFLKAARRARPDNGYEKLSLKQHDLIIDGIKQKSEAAKVFSSLSEGHREVVEMCDHYLDRNQNELRHIGNGSPRLVPLRKGKKEIEALHRFHTLKWVETETNALSVEAKSSIDANQKLKSASAALDVLDKAIKYYPEERVLTDTREVLDGFITTVQVHKAIENAEVLTDLGDFSKAISVYRDALFLLGRDNIKSEEKKQTAERINNEISRIRELYSLEN